MNKWQIICPAAAILIFGLVCGVIALRGQHRGGMAVASRIGPKHVFELSESPPFLTEELALKTARDALVQDGYDLSVWQPKQDGRTAAPDGRTDEFAARNMENPNRLVFAFTNGSALTRFVSVELAGREVICQSSLGK